MVRKSTRSRSATRGESLPATATVTVATEEVTANNENDNSGGESSREVEITIDDGDAVQRWADQESNSSSNGNAIFHSLFNPNSNGQVNEKREKITSYDKNMQSDN